MSAKRVLSVGQCSFDHGNISKALNAAFPVEIVKADSTEEALEQVRTGTFSLVLINRILDETGESGMELVRTLRTIAELQDTPVMLVSNFPEAQSEAIGLGAVPGFGKLVVGKPAMLETLEPFLKS